MAVIRAVSLHSTGRRTKRVGIYLGSQIVAGLVFVGSILAFNYHVDPYELYSGRAVIATTSVKPARETRLRLHKVAAVEAIRPTGLILGSSRANRSLDPTHSAWRARNVYNFAVPGGNILETRGFFEHAQATRPLEQVILAADFFMFNALRATAADFKNDRLRAGPLLEYVQARMHESISTLLSLDALGDSITTVLRGRQPCGADQVWLYLTRADGFTGSRKCGPYDPHKIFTHIIPAFVSPRATLDGKTFFYRPFSFENLATDLI